MMRMLWVPLGVLLLISTAASQDSAPTKPTELTGKVSVDGKPIQKGRILFYSREGQIVGCIIHDGKYKIDKPIVGQQTVTINGPDVSVKYSEPETSGLATEVQRDIKNVFDFDLQAK